jgi:biotin carboxyl carrier protein
MLRADVEQARVDELSRLAAYEREKRRGDQFFRKFGIAQVLAPIDGTVQHIHPTPTVEEGAEVREGQLLVRIQPEPRREPPSR